MDGCSSLFDVVIVGVLKTMSVLCLISSFFFSKPYWTSSQYGETIIFLPFWIFLIYVIFVFDLYTPVYFLCTWASLFRYQSLLLIKKNVTLGLHW